MDMWAFHHSFDHIYRAGMILFHSPVTQDNMSNKPVVLHTPLNLFIFAHRLLCGTVFDIEKIYIEK